MKIKRIEAVVNLLQALEISNEQLYKLTDLEQTLQAFTDNEIDASDIALIPYYVQSGKLMELYYCELRITVVQQKDFNKYLLGLAKRSKRKSINEIPNDVLDRHKNCYKEITANEKHLSKKIILEYINYIMHSQDLHERLTRAFGAFDKEQLYFQVY